MKIQLFLSLLKVSIKKKKKRNHNGRNCKKLSSPFNEHSRDVFYFLGNVYNYFLHQSWPAAVHAASPLTAFLRFQHFRL